MFLFSRLSFLLLFLAILVHGQQVMAQALDNTTPPQVLDIDDPFSRDLKRAADDATGGIIFNDTAIGIEEEEETGASLMGRESRLAVMASKMRVVGVAVSKQPDSNQVFVHFKDNALRGTKPLLNYLRIGTHPSIDDAQQQAINLKSSFIDFLDASLIIREAEDTSVVDLDIGPFSDVAHAERYCDMLLDITFGLVSDCYVVQEFPGIEPLNTFNSTAMLKFSPDAVSSVISDTSIFDLPGAALQTINAREGQSIGSGSGIVVKVLADGVMVVDEIGSVVSLPVAYIPEDEFKEDQGGGGLALPQLPVEGGAAPASDGEVEKPQTAADILLGDGEEQP